MIPKRLQNTRFTWLFCSLVILIASYPWFQDSTRGAAVGGIVSLLILGTGVYAVRAARRTRILCGALAVAAATASIVSLLGHVRGSVWSEATFTAYYAVTTVAVFAEIFRMHKFDGDTILGIVSVYLLIGITFGSLYDLLETLEPGSFQINVEHAANATIGFRRLLFFSFMTLTSVGYGDLTPVTDRAQSLAILEGVAGVLYVAVLVGGVVGAYEKPAKRRAGNSTS